MADTVKRMNYYDHQFLRAADFTDEQNYHLNMRRLHNSQQHTWGVVQGLGVTVASGGTGTAVSVSAGIAMDSKGQEMVQPQDTNLELGGEKAGTTLYITIAYDAQPSDPSTEAGGPGNTRITELPKISFSNAPPPDTSMTLILAKVPRTASGLGTVDLSDRKQAGVVLGSDLTLNTLTLKKDGVAQANWPVWTCGGANQAALANAGLYVNGNVGIGTTAPSSRLQVAGGDVTVSDGLLHVSGGANPPTTAQGAYLGWNALTGVTGETDFINNQGGGTGGFAFMNTPASGNPKATLMVIAGSGNVGIGVPAPGNKLDVGDRIRLRQGGSGDAGLWLYQTKSAEDRAFVGMDGDDQVGLFGNKGAGWGLTMNVTNGNLGIGTTAPSSRLQVAGGDVTVSDGLLHVSGGANPPTTAQGAYLGWNALTGVTGETDFINNQGGGTGGFAFMNTPASGNPKATLMVIAGSGNVGIGVPAPGNKLDVGDRIRLRQGGSGDAGLWLYQTKPAEDRAFVGMDGDDKVGFFGNKGASWGLTMDVTNGQTIVEHALFVRGGLNYFWGPDNQWKNIQNRSGDMAGSYNTGAPASDLRLKEEVQLLPSALEKTRKLRGVSFRWNADALQYFTRDIETACSAGPHATDEENQKLWQAERDKSYKELSKTNVGVIAQEVEAVLPEAVTADEAGYKTVQYRDLIPLLIEAVKEQDAIVAAQAERIAQIDRLIAAQRVMQDELKELAAVKAQVAQLVAAMQHANGTPVHLAPGAQARCSTA